MFVPTPILRSCHIQTKVIHMGTIGKSVEGLFDGQYLKKRVWERNKEMEMLTIKKSRDCETNYKTESKGWKSVIFENDKDMLNGRSVSN